MRTGVVLIALLVMFVMPDMAAHSQSPRFTVSGYGLKRMMLFCNDTNARTFWFRLNASQSYDAKRFASRVYIKDDEKEECFVMFNFVIDPDSMHERWLDAGYRVYDIKGRNADEPVPVVLELYYDGHLIRSFNADVLPLTKGDEREAINREKLRRYMEQEK
jgi:hypothetical protein